MTASVGASVPGWSSSAAFVDYDHDGRLDLFVGRYLGWTWESNIVCPSADGSGRAYCHPRQFSAIANVLLRNKGDGTFTDVSLVSHTTGVARATLQNAGWGTKFIDFDNDGLRDLFVAQSDVLDTVSRARQGFDYLQPPLMLRNSGSSFINVSTSLGPAFARATAGRGAAFGDVDDDGDTDIVVANLDGAPTLLRNDGGNANHWLTVKLRVTGSNRQGIGAVITVFDDRGRSQSGVCSTASSYQSASDSRVHFGLGDATVVRQLEVRWPSGRGQMLKDVGADRILEVIEPAS